MTLRTLPSVVIIAALGFFPGDLLAASKIAVPPSVKVKALDPGTPTRPLKLSKVISSIRRGDIIGSREHGILCNYPTKIESQSDAGEIDLTHFAKIFSDEVSRLGFETADSSKTLFGTTGPDFLVGADIKSMNFDVCMKWIGVEPTSTVAKGALLLEVEWQLLRVANKEVVETVTTKTGYFNSKSQEQGILALELSAFAEGVRALIATGKIQPHVIGARIASPPPVTVSSADQSVSTLPVAKSLTPLLVSLPGKAVGGIEGGVNATILIQASEGHGSGFLISRDGYYLTNSHVVGTDKTVRVRWSDGLEQRAEVVRVDDIRDVAVIKASSRDLVPLRLNSKTPPVGSEVYAIGSPLDDTLQNSVTKGIVSANRTIEGLAFIQSDVSILPGNSGGPLVDKNGDVIGLAVAGVEIRDVPVGVNFFIPAGEALQVLGIRPSLSTSSSK